MMRIICGVLGLLGLLYGAFCAWLAFTQKSGGAAVEIEMLIAGVVATAGLGLAGVMDTIERAGRKSDELLLRQIELQIARPAMPPPIPR